MAGLLRRRAIWRCVRSFALRCPGLAASSSRARAGRSGVVDLSLLVSPKMPCVWPTGMTPYQLVADALDRAGRIQSRRGRDRRAHRHAIRRAGPFRSAPRFRSARGRPDGQDHRRQGARSGDLSAKPA